MRKYVAVAMWIAVAIGPASAFDVGIGGKVGGIGVGANVGLGSKGASLGLGANVGKAAGAKAEASVGKSNGSPGASLGVSGNVGEVAGAKAEASVGKSNGSLGASLGVSGNVGGKSGGVSVDAGTGGVSVDTGGGSPGGNKASPSPTNTADRASTAAGNTAGGTGAASRNTAGGTGAASRNSAGGSSAGSGAAAIGAVGAPATIARTKSVRHSIVLPRMLRPSKSGRDTFVRRGTRGYPLKLQALSKAFPKAIPGTPPAVVRVCRQAIASAATPLGAVRVHAASAGPPRRQRRGAITAPIEVRIHYARQGGIEVRQARVGCRLDSKGRVIAVVT